MIKRSGENRRQIINKSLCLSKLAFNARLTGLISVSELKNRVLTMAVDLCRLTTRTMNVNAGHERTSKARIIHQIQLIRGITTTSA
ncbi:hypothetical protein Asd1617_00216 [Shigella dysenteriae 1617]|uniref:Transposase n=1 Tax=Shigella dysenteriae 1617 TaxID=754093 RepID=A0A0A6ZLW5_SHIDY|nr:hypothetical protein Asd1617_00216 [Shigella dysenteriae 1617]